MNNIRLEPGQVTQVNENFVLCLARFADNNKQKPRAHKRDVDPGPAESRSLSAGEIAVSPASGAAILCMTNNTGEEMPKFPVFMAL